MKSSGTEESLFEKERKYSEEIYKTRWQAEALNPHEFEGKFSVPLRDGGKNLRFRPRKAQFDFLLKSEGPRFLDCACGAGHLSIWLAQHGKKAWAFDFAESAIDVAKGCAEKSGVADNITFDVMDARNLEYGDGYFDVVTGMDCIHHLIKYPEAIIEMARVLKPGGKAVFVEPLTRNPLINMLRSINIHYRKRVGEHMLTKRDLESLEREFGIIRLDHFTVFSAFSKLIARKRQQIVGIRGRLCMILDSFDVFVLKILPFLSRYASVCYMELTKTASQTPREGVIVKVEEMKK